MKMKAKGEPPLHHGLGHAAALAAQHGARVPARAPFAVTKKRSESWYRACALSVTLTVRQTRPGHAGLP